MLGPHPGCPALSTISPAPENNTVALLFNGEKSPGK